MQMNFHQITIQMMIKHVLVMFIEMNTAYWR
jgi:hypothetical protein